MKNVLVAIAFAALAGCVGTPFNIVDGNPPVISASNDTQDTISVLLDGKEVMVVGPFVGPTKPEEIGLDGKGPMTSIWQYQVTPNVVSVRISSGIHQITGKAIAGPGLSIGRTWTFDPHRFTGSSEMVVRFQIPKVQRAPEEYWDNTMYGG